MAFLKAYYDWDWPAAEREFQQSITLDAEYASAHDWYATFLTAMGRYNDAISEAKLAQEIEPLSLIISMHKARPYYYARRYTEAIEQLHSTLEVDPSFVAHMDLGRAYARNGMMKEAAAEFDRVRDLYSDDVWTRAELAHAYAVSGQAAEAQSAVQSLEAQSRKTYISGYWIAMAYAALQQDEKAFSWLEKAYRERDPWLIYLNVEPTFDRLRLQARYTALLEKVGFRN
jgi:adenylate cyclase